jgi:hypothetical protein
MWTISWRNKHKSTLGLSKERIIRYVAGTVNIGCLYGKGEEWKLYGYSDSDLSSDIDTRKCTPSVMFFLGYSPVSWKSQKEKVVELSSCEAEYIAAATATCQGIWLARLLWDLKNIAVEAVELKVDNKNPVFHDRSKHIHTRFHFIQEASGSGEIRADFISTRGQLADILTKVLPRARF